MGRTGQRNRVNNYYSQFGEDRWIEENILLPAMGIFCEVGAYDGLSGSNTLHFEQLGWSGILVEADPELAARCERNRQAKTFSCAVGSEDHGGVFHVNDSDRGASGFQAKGRKIIVPVFRLDYLIGTLPIDLLSIDTEGTELEVWESIGTVRPEIVIMEYRTFDNPPQDAAIVARMEKDGYREVHRTDANLIFKGAQCL